MATADRGSGKPRWAWQRRGGARLFGADGTEYEVVDELTRVEVERLLSLGDLDAVEVMCGAGIQRWVGPAGADELWSQVQGSLDDVEDWRPPAGSPGALPYRAELWRSASSRHVLLFTNE